MPNGFTLLGNLGVNAAKNPVGTAVGMGVLVGGVGLGASALLNPIDTIESAAVGGTVASKYPGTAMAIGAGALAVGGLGYMGARRMVRNPAGKVRNVASLGKSAFKAATTPPSRFMSSTASLPGRAVGGLTKSFGKTWDRRGAGFGVGVAMGFGLLYGGAKALGTMALGTGEYDEAMSRSVEGSAYEQGPGSFGRRTQGSRVKTLGDSAMGLSMGLHNKRHG